MFPAPKRFARLLGLHMAIWTDESLVLVKACARPVRSVSEEGQGSVGSRRLWLFRFPVDV